MAMTTPNRTSVLRVTRLNALMTRMVRSGSPGIYPPSAQVLRTGGSPAVGQHGSI
jgi:hypothetical protein